MLRARNHRTLESFEHFLQRSRRSRFDGSCRQVAHETHAMVRVRTAGLAKEAILRCFALGKMCLKYAREKQQGATRAKPKCFRLIARLGCNRLKILRGFFLMWVRLPPRAPVFL